MAVINGDGGPNTINDTSDDDTIDARGGDDTITVTEGGTDTVHGGAGNDRLIVDYSASGTAVSMTVTPTAPVVVGYPAPGGTSFSTTGVGGDELKAGGRTRTYSSLDPSQYDHLYWGPSAPQASANELSNAPASYTNLETMTLSSMVGNVATWIGQITVPQVGGGTATIYTAYRATIVTAEASNWVSAASVDISGGPEAVFEVSGTDFQVKYEFLGTTDSNRTSYSPLKDVYDSVSQRDPAYSLKSGFNGQFASDYDGYSGTVQDGAGNKVTFVAIDSFDVTGGSGDDTFVGGAGDDRFVGGAGRNFYWLQLGGNDAVIGGTGTDVLYFGGAMTSGDTVDADGGRDQIILQGNYGSLTFGTSMTGIDSVVLLRGSDTRYGDTSGGTYSYNITIVNQNVAAGERLTVDAAQLRAGENFTFNGSAETDGSFHIYGGTGTDTLTGSSNTDRFQFNEGAFGSSDVVNGGDGRDQLVLRGDYFMFFGANQLVSIESIALLSGYDIRANTDYNYTLFMSDGNVAAGAVLTIDAGQLRSDEMLTFFGNTELDGRFRIFGGQGGDQILGGEGADDIRGGGGTDNLYSRGGADKLTGGAGNDRFAYDSTDHSSPTAMDTILDFTSGDVIALNTIDANPSTPADDAFTFIGSAAFTPGTPGQLRVWEVSGEPGHWFVEADVNGDATADLMIEVYTTGGHMLVASDFDF